VAADRNTARVLGVAPGQPVLQVRRTALTFGDRPVEYRVSHRHPPPRLRASAVEADEPA
jgi:DNA-binding GntR family transcriptional regulator